MRFATVFIATATVAQFVYKIAIFAEPFLHIDVMTISIEYGYKGTESWRRSFLECLKDAFKFGPEDQDGRFAFGCSYDLLYHPYDDYFKRWDPTVDTTVSGCQIYRHENKINEVLKSTFFVFIRPDNRQHMIVTIIFADETLNYDIKSSSAANDYIKWPNQLYVAIENSTADTSNLAKQGFDISHVLKFTVGKCSDLVNQLQHLLCRGAPKLGNCEPITSDPSKCKAGLESYDPSRLENAALVCPGFLVATPAEKGEKFDCTCPTTSVLSTVTSEANPSDTAPVKKPEDDRLPGGIIALIVVGVIVLFAVVAGCVWCRVFRRSGGSTDTAGAKGGSQTAGAIAGGSQLSPSQRAEGRASPKSVSKLQKSVSKSPISVSKPQKSVSHQKSGSKQQKSMSQQPQKSMKSVVRDGQSTTGGIQRSPSQRAEGRASPKSVSKLQKSVSKSPISMSKPQKSVSKHQKSVSKQQKSVSQKPKKSTKSVVRGGQSKTGGSKMAKSGMGKR